MANEKNGTFDGSKSNGHSNKIGLQRSWLQQETAIPAAQFQGSLSSQKTNGLSNNIGLQWSWLQHEAAMPAAQLQDSLSSEKMNGLSNNRGSQRLGRTFLKYFLLLLFFLLLVSGSKIGQNQNQLLNYTKDDVAYKIEDSSWIGEFFNSQMPTGFESPLSANLSAGYSSQYSFSSSGSSTVIDGLPDSPIYEINLSEYFSGNKQDSGVGEFEEASQVVPKLNMGFSTENGWVMRAPKKETDLELKVGKREDAIGVPFQNATHSDDENGPKRQKDPHREDLDLEDRQSNKHSALYSDNVIRTESFDEVLLCGCKNGKNFADMQVQVLQNGVQKSVQNGSVKGSQGPKTVGKKQGKREVVHLRSLLLICAQAVAADDTRGANETLKQIRQHASAYGDGSQRLANYFADGMAARLSGSGGRLFTMISSGALSSAAEILKAYQLLLVATPFKKISHFMTYQTVLNVAEGETRLHIVDFGILYGFQWPSLIQCLANRPGGPPMLRITGIEFPQPGFRPAERIEETGRRLEDYAKSFGVPFEYQAIATKWENLDVEELGLRSDEVLVVNCLGRLRNLLDETVVQDSPRNIVLNKIRSMNPRVFIQGVVNGAYNASFFITRFREALFHYSALFDALETTVPRDNQQRFLIEKEIFGREILNVVACEGSERLERPETYKQGQERTQRAGFVQLPLDRSILSKSRDKVKTFYHNDFGVDEDGNWMLFGWKGRTIHALSTWRPST
uniref:SCARECROW-like protein n=1 Tax=Pinus taeda TaxID=3352 RepID=G0ZAE8_PINTA|nr:SCARECROW-like protein [Pinus taeda]